MHEVCPQLFCLPQAGFKKKPAEGN